MHALDENLNPLTPPDASTAKKIRDILSASGYLSCDYFKSAGKTGVPEDDKRGALLNGKTGGLAPGTIFEALFYAGETLNREPVKQALRPMEITEWVRLGLLREENDRVRANVQLLAYRDLVIAHDFKEHGLSRNHVIGITPATDALARLTIRRHSGDTLDLGAGSGVQALLAASHSDKVIATDINKRAVNIADFNAELNGCRNVENIAGNLFEPVAGKTFDLIVSCPPFVISPDSQYYYLDSGSTGDSMLERIVRESAGHLNEGGYCQLMSEVVQYSGQTWPRRLFGWLDGLGCDAWMLHRATMSPEEYARVWVMDRSESPEDLMREWLAYYREQNIEAITSGLLTIRKRSNAANWYRIDQLPAGIGDCGASIDQG
ncbi:MAG TPA: methyltransferase, partial [Gammaproteobacteria bacterium]|nr:methyltransferase [Gammaproteobacteria bacterium]